MSEFKQVGPTLDEINRANRDAWDSGEFRHAADVRHTPEGAQEQVRNGQVVSHHDSTIGERMDARVDAEEARHSGDAVHLPRTRKRTWKKPEWS